MILTKWFLFTRLETRTKESNTCASIWVWKLVCVMKVNCASVQEVCTCEGSISSGFAVKQGLRESTCVRTRKMVNYAWAGWSQGKLWWKLVAVLTCKSFVWLGY